MGTTAVTEIAIVATAAIYKDPALGLALAQGFTYMAFNPHNNPLRHISLPPSFR